MIEVHLSTVVLGLAHRQANVVPSLADVSLITPA